MEGSTQLAIRASVLCAGILLLASASAWTQDSEPQIQGEWRMELRIRHEPGVILNQQDIVLFVSDKMPDGSYRLLTHFTIHAVAESEELLLRPECEGKSECTYDNGSEGIGRLVGDKFYVDWLNDSWIDDVFTISGNRMSGDDGNGPLEFVKSE